MYLKNDANENDTQQLQPEVVTSIDLVCRMSIYALLHTASPDHVCHMSTQVLTHTVRVHSIPMETSVMATINCHQPDVDEVFQVSNNINQIFSKTNDNN